MKDGKILFQKDGYTDFKGKFDYATSSTCDIKTVDKFSIFVMSDTLGE